MLSKAALHVTAAAEVARREPGNAIRSNNHTLPTLRLEAAGGRALLW